MGLWNAFDGSCPPHTRPDKRAARGKIHDLSGTDAAHGMHAGLDKEGEMRIGTQAAIRHQHIPFLQARMDRLHPGQIVGEEGRDHQLEAHTGARMEQPQQPRPGEAAPRPLLRWLAERVLEGRGIGHGAARAIDEKRAMTMPPPFVQGGSLYGAAEALEAEGEEG